MIRLTNIEYCRTHTRNQHTKLYFSDPLLAQYRRVSYFLSVIVRQPTDQPVFGWGQVKFPSRETVFDYWLEPKSGTFVQWTKSPYFFPIEYDSRVTSMTQVSFANHGACGARYTMVG